MPRILSFHFSSNCNLPRKCPFCYVKIVRDKPFSFWKRLPEIMCEIGIQQCTIGGGEPFLYPKFLSEFTKECKDYGIICNITTNGYMLPREDILKQIHATMISISVDEYKTKVHDLEILDSKLALLKSLGFYVGINYLLTSVKALYEIPEHFSIVRDLVDMFYVLQLKKYNNPIKPNLLYLLKVLSLQFPISVDDSIALAIGVKKICGRGTELISVFSDGSIAPCSFDKPIAILNKVEDLKEIVETIYPLKATTKCKFIRNS